jgi:hypothetical protein
MERIIQAKVLRIEKPQGKNARAVCVNDYEGISGYEVFRSDLTLMYLPAIDPRRGQLVEARLVPKR